MRKLLFYFAVKANSLQESKFSISSILGIKNFTAIYCCTREAKEYFRNTFLSYTCGLLRF